MSFFLRECMTAKLINIKYAQQNQFFFHIKEEENNVLSNIISKYLKY